MEQTDLAYAAGIIDGEGSVTIQRQGLRNIGVPIVTVGMTHLPTLQFLKALLGGTVHEMRRASRRPMWRWYSGGQVAVNALASLQPFLRTKTAQAWLACEYWAQRTVYTPHPVPPEEVALREGYKLAISYLNQGGDPNGEATA